MTFPTDLKTEQVEKQQPRQISNGLQEDSLDDDAFPEGGWRAWLAILGGWIIQFCTFGYTNSFGVYNDFYIREYMKDKYSSSQLSWIGSVQLMLVLSVGLFVGRAFDHGYFYHLVIGGSALFVFCVFMISLTQPGQYYQVFLAQGVGMGISIGLTYLTSLAITSHYFLRHRAVMMGIVASGSGVGGALHPVMLNRVFNGPIGFHRGVRISAGINLGLLTCAILMIRTRLVPISRKQGSPWADFRRFVRDPPYVLTVIGTTMMLTGLYFPIFFLQLNAIQKGIDRNQAFTTLPVLNGGSTVGRIIATLFVPRVGVYNVVVPCAASCAILIFCMLLVDDFTGTMVFASLYGLFSGGYIGILAPMIASLAKNQSEIGARMGICFAFTGFGGLIGSPIAGALLSTSFYWWKPTLFAGLCVSCGSLMFASSRLILSRRLDSGWKV